jgi:hypothetical protein
MASTWAAGELANPCVPACLVAAQIDPIWTISVEIQHESASAQAAPCAPAVAGLGPSDCFGRAYPISGPVCRPFAEYERAKGDVG